MTHRLSRRRSLALLLTASLALTTASCKKESGGGTTSSSSTTAPNGQTTIAVIPKGATHEHWQRVKAGAEKAGKELNVSILWKSPPDEGAKDRQIQIVEQATADAVSAIVVAPLDDKSLVRPIKQAFDAKIPVVLIDSGLDGQVGKDFVAYVGTDNRKGGEMAGEAMAKALGNKGNVVMLRYQVGSASTAEREAGFVDAIKKHPDIKIISDNQYAGPTSDTAQTAAARMLDVLGQAQGVYCPNESSTYGMLLALRKADLLSKVKFVGFDTSDPLLKAVRSGEIDAVVAQNPLRMGYLGVKAAVDALKGQKVDPNIDTGEILITKENIDSPEVKALFEK